MRKGSGNKGFTLIELIISIAILSIVGLAIFGFMATSSNLYGREVTQADLQYESQLVINQLQDMLIDASQSVTYFVTSGGTAAEVPNDEGIDESAVTKKEVRIYDGTKYYQVTWDKAEERLYYTEYNAAASGGPSAKAALGAGAATPGSWEVNPSANHVRMADYVREFSVDITNLEKNRSVMFRFLFAINNVSYATQHNITLRNRVVKGEGESGTITVVTPKQEGITVSPASIMVWPGDAVAFTHTITSKTGGFPSQEADWSVSASGGNALAPDTALSGSGALSVSMDEKNPDLTVTVTVKEGVEKEDGMVNKPSASAAVQVKQVQGMTVVLTDEGSYKGTNTKEDRLIPGSTLQFEVSSISGPHTAMQDLTATGVTITWEVEKGAEYASIDENGLLTVSNEAPVDTVLQVKAVFNRVGREWAYGDSSEYKVVELKERGVIYVDDDYDEYEAPEEELWINEPKKISLDWSKLPDVFKENGSGRLKNQYRFLWEFVLEGNNVDDTQAFEFHPSGGDTQNAAVIIGVPGWMEMYQSERGVRIQLKIYENGNQWNGKLVYESNVAAFKFPDVHYQYSYTKGGTFVDERSFFLTPQSGEVYVYYDIYGYHDDGNVGSLEKLYNFSITNQGNIKEYGGIGNGQFLKIDANKNIFYFVPSVDAKGSSIINHLNPNKKLDASKLIIYCEKANVENENYYVPLPNDTGWMDGGYLFGDCSYQAEYMKPPAGTPYYKLTITDNRGEVPKTIISYWQQGNKQWEKDEPYGG